MRRFAALFAAALLWVAFPSWGAEELRSAPTGNELGLIVRPINTGTQDVNCVSGCGPGGSSGAKITDGTAAGEADVINSAPAGTEYGLVVRPIVSGTQAVSGTVTGNQGTAAGIGSAWPVKITDGTDTADVTAAGRLQVDGSGVTQPVSGTVTANAGTGTFVVQPVVPATSVVTEVNASPGSTLLLAANATRKSFLVYNASDANLMLKLGTTVSRNSFTTVVPPGATWQPPSHVNYQGDVSALWETPTGVALVTELGG